MKKNAKKIDIRILKVEKYIKGHPKKVYGYYCLGKLQLISGQYKAAEDCFKKALSLDNRCTAAKIAVMEAYICRNKFLKAVHYYNRSCQAINESDVFKTRLVKAISSYYGKNAPDMKSRGLFSHMLLKRTARSMQNLFNKNFDNIVVLLLLCMYYLTNGTGADRAVVIYNTCAALDGLDDKMRWEMVKVLAKDNPLIYHDTEIAAKFSSIPDAGCPAQYADTIFNAFLEEGRLEKVRKLFKSINDGNKPLLLSNLWKYVYLCREKSIYDASVYQCCKQLLNSGWIDRLVAETVSKLKELHIAEHTEDEDKILGLYGYSK